ncbi:hypothetical protein CEXT_471761 [Caerostris extrusa]|uniref:Uncharacterized protein n=1 Tax=Caerostris extrusa TaxID=172846 RepID=A0AAV4RQ65_CAEEX|nr:hypothetical protein CEXT_471761 [Caerostris extrusa]
MEISQTSHLFDKQQEVGILSISSANIYAFNEKFYNMSHLKFRILVRFGYAGAFNYALDEFHETETTRDEFYKTKTARGEFYEKLSVVAQSVPLKGTNRYLH